MKRLITTTPLAVILAACGSPSPDTQPDKKVGGTVSGAPQTEAAIAPNPEKNAYFGDLHIHTKNSFDAYIFNVRNTPDDVYRFAKGDTIRHPLGISESDGNWYILLLHAWHMLDSVDTDSQ